MSPSFLFVVSTLATWVGWLAVLRAVYFGLSGVFGRFGTAWRSAAVSAGIGGVCLLLAASLPASGERAAGLALPVLWPVMPFTAWAAAAGIGFATARFVQALSAITPEEARARRISGLGWAAFAALFGFLFWRSGTSVEILKGAIRLTPTSAAGLGLLALFSMFAVVATAGHSRARGIAKGVANHLALLAGAVVFGLPFAWLLITSFKEDRDMSSATGLVWIPRVTEKTPYLDPANPLVEGRYEGEPVEGPIIEKFADGSARVEINKPAVLRGLTFIANPPLKIVPKMVNVVEARFQGENVVGRVIEDLADGGARVEVLRPETLKGQVFDAEPEAVTLVRPVGLKWTNYPEALDYLPRETNRGLVYLKNTLILVVLNVIGTVLSSSLVAYAFARLRFPGRGILFVILLSTMMLPAAVTLIPQFLIFRYLDWIDTLRPLWVTAFFGSAFNIFLLRQFFMGIPMELEDAAKIDGCGYLRTFWQVMLPQIKPALAVVSIWTFMGAWNNFMGPLIYINSPENMPISYALQLFQGDRLSEPGYLMAFATMTMLPVLLVFFFAQKYFIEGVTLSGLGGR